MSNSISILLRRNLDVFGENDPARRRAVIDEIFTQSPSPMCRAMAGGSNGYRAVQVRLQLTLELTSSLPGKAA